jgi:hypothetical protein
MGTPAKLQLQAPMAIGFIYFVRSSQDRTVSLIPKHLLCCWNVQACTANTQYDCKVLLEARMSFF